MAAIKATLRIPTEDQYAFIELQMDVDSEDAAVEAYKRVTGLVKASVGGLSQKDWNRLLDQYRTSGSMHPEDHEKMNKAQSWLIHELDKSDSRIEPKNNKITN